MFILGIVLRFGKIAYHLCLLKDRYPQLFGICNYHECLVKDCLNVNINDFFRRRLTPELGEQWNNVVDTMRGLILSSDPDQIGWALGHGKNSL